MGKNYKLSAKGVEKNFSASGDSYKTPSSGEGATSGEAGTTSDSGMLPVSSMTPSQIRKEKLSIWKNVCIISIAFMFLFTAFNSMANLQSSINSVAGLGTYSLSTLYAALVVSCMFVPTFLIKTLKCKWTIVVCQLCYSTYIAAQFYPAFATLLPTAIVLGFGAAPMWSAKCTYLTQVGSRYAELNGDQSSEPIVNRFFGLFFMTFQTSQIWGNLISSLVLSTGKQNETISAERLEVCGANFCSENLYPVNNETNQTTESSVPSEQLYTMAGIYLGFAILASVIIAVLVDSLARYGENSRQGSGSGKSGVQLLVATFQHMKHPYQILLIPLTLWAGFEQAFLGADYTAAFITCPLGVWNVGFVLICYGTTDAVASLCAGAVVKKIGRIPLFVFATIINLSLIITLLIWRPNPTQTIAIYVIAALWGLADSIWQTQLNSFYGIIFADSTEAAFSNHRLWESIGFIIAYIYSTLICINAKLYVLLGVLGSGMIGYGIIEIMEYRRKNREKQQL